MSDVVLVKTETGKLDGLGVKGQRAWQKFRRVIAELVIGETLHFEYRLPRSRPHHGFFFASLVELFDRQEQFTDQDRLLDWLKVGAGFADLMPGHDGVPVAIPRSIAWHRLEEQEFIEFHRAVRDFLWTDYAQAFLWPHLDEEKRHLCVESWVAECERRRQEALSRRPNG